MKCQTCNKKFIKKKLSQKHCSQKCYFNRMPKVKIICETCNKSFYALSRLNRKYCSTKCMYSNEKYKVQKNLSTSLHWKEFGHPRGALGKTWEWTKESKLRFSKSPSRKKRKHLTFEHCQKISKVNRGPMNYFWIDGRSREKNPYPEEWSETLRRRIRERDHYTCQLSGKKSANCVHHIDYNKKNCDPNNLITLSLSSNSKVNSNREYWTAYFRELNFQKVV